jgi:hypothetical protein
MNLIEKRSSSSIDSTSSVNSSQSSSVTYHSYFASSTNNSKNSHLMPDNNIEEKDFDEDEDDECSITDFDLQENVNSIVNNEKRNHSLDESLNGKHSDESEKLNDSTLKENEIRENGEILFNDCETDQLNNISTKNSDREVSGKLKSKSNYRMANDQLYNEKSKLSCLI